MDQWQVCLPGAHAGYIDWDEYLRNQRILAKNRAAFHASAQRQPPPRKGNALLQSRIICGICGHRMNGSLCVSLPAPK